MRISITNKNLSCVGDFLNSLNLKGQLSLSRSRLLNLIEKKQKEFNEDRKLIVENCAEKNEKGEPIENEDGTLKLSSEGNKQAGEEITELLEEEAVIEYGEYTSKIAKLEDFLKEYNDEVSGSQAQGFFALTTAFETKEDK